MNDAAGVVAFASRGCLALALALLLDGLVNVVASLVNGGATPSPLQPWRDLRRLAGMQALLPEGASALVRATPTLTASATFAAATLTPSFASGGPGDLLNVAGLLGLAGLAHSLALADGGAAIGGDVAARGLVAGALALPALIALALFAGLSGGGEASAIALAACAATALATASCSDDARNADARVWSGIDLALMRASASLRTVTILTVLASGFLPIGLGSGGDFATWPLGFFAWAVKVIVLGGSLALLRARFAVPIRPLLGFATVVSALALLALLARQVSA